jgi:PAS domain-containing protein
MHTAFEIVMGVYLWVLSSVSRLANWLTVLGDDPAHHYSLAAVVVTSLLVGLGCCLWAVVTHLRHRSYRSSMRSALARAQSDVRFREAMILACPEAIAVLGSDMNAPLSYRGGAGLLQAALDGPDAAILAAKLEDLLAAGTGFAATVRTASFPQVAVRGCAIGSRAAVFFRIDRPADEPEHDFPAILDALPLPIWIRNRHLVLTWANRAFLAATGSATLREALLKDASLDRSERDLARAASEGREVTAAKRYAVVNGERRSLTMDLKRLNDRSIAGFAVDTTAQTRAEARLQLSIDAFGAVLNTLETAVAIFGADQQLIAYNTAYVRMWHLPEPWLDAHPTLGDIFDRLREMRRVPEQRNFAAWKKEHLQQFHEASQHVLETWHLPTGMSVDVRSVPYLLGGTVYLFRDISERLRMEATHQLLLNTQRAVFNTIDHAQALFGPDGRLRMHNDAFLKLWQIGENELAGEPHLTKIADLCAARIGRDGIWSMIAAGVNSSEPERLGEWGDLARADGKALSLGVTRLPDGATLVTFSDNTDLARFNEAITEPEIMVPQAIVPAKVVTAA